MLNSQISSQWTNLILYKQTNWVKFSSIKETKQKQKQKKNNKKRERERECVAFIFDPLVKPLNLKRGMLHYRLHCLCFILFPSVHTSLFMFHPISLSPHLIDHVSFLFPSVHSPSHSFHLPHSISFMFTLFDCIRITWSFNLIVSSAFQPILSLEIYDLQGSLDTFLILDKYSLLEADRRCFYYSLSLYIKQEI